MPSNPPVTDPAEQGANHIQGIKNVLINTFGVVTSPYILKQGADTHFAFLFPQTGMQIVGLYRVGTDIAIDGAYGPLFIGSYSWTFLAGFVAPPVVTCSSFFASGQAGWGGVTVVGNTTAILRGYDVASHAMGTSVTIAALAIGRYK